MRLFIDNMVFKYIHALIIAFIAILGVSFITQASVRESTAGKILLQVEDNGEAWYVHPETTLRYYLQDGNAAYQIMRQLSLGITDKDLDTIPVLNSAGELAKTGTACARNGLGDQLVGKILLQVEQNGEAWYVVPGSCHRIYLKNGDTAYTIMRLLGLGITNADLGVIPVADGFENLQESIVDNSSPDNSQTTEFDIVAFLEAYDATNENVRYTVTNDHFQVSSTSIATHEVGAFPNSGNPNSISAQDYEYQIPRNPSYTGAQSSLRTFGFSLGGVKFEPGTAERDDETGWNIEGLQNMFPLGMDLNNAHVQPTGAYHYHGIPKSLAGKDGEHSPLIGFASDGFPIYIRYGHPSDSSTEIKNLQPSWQLKSGQRGAGEPDGVYNGVYTQDFEFITGSGDLDECNGLFTASPEYPDGTYAYFLTDDFPFIPRCHNGSPDDSFDSVDGGGGGPPGGGFPPPRR